VGVDAQEAFAQGNEDRDMEERVGGQRMEMNPVNKLKTVEEFMDMNG
jgi:hypothetical protein